MKTIFLISALAIAMGSSFAASAADSTGEKGQSSKALSVTGSIGAPTCTFEMNSGQAVEFGTIALSQIHMDQVTAGNISSMGGAFSVKCDAKTLVRMQVKDTYAGTLLKDNRHQQLFSNRYGRDAQFGLVDKNDTDKLVGSYIIEARTISTTDDGKDTTRNLHVQGGRNVPVFVTTKGDSGEQETLVIGDPNGVASKIVNVGFHIEPNFLPKKSWLTEGSDIEIVGDATFSMVYL